MNRQMKLIAVICIVGYLNLISDKIIAGDTTMVSKSFVLNVQDYKKGLTRENKEDIRQVSNEMFESDKVVIFYNFESDKNAAVKISECLLAEGISPERISIWKTSKDDFPAAKRLNRNEFLVAYKTSIKNSTGNTNNIQSEPVDSLCLIDTILKLENGYCLKYRICDYLTKQSIPTIRLIDPNGNEKFSETLEKTNTAALSTISAIFKVQKAANDSMYDEVLVPAKSIKSSKQIVMEIFDEKHRVWLPAEVQWPKKLKIGKASYYSCPLSSTGYYRLLTVDQNKNVVLIRAPKGTAFTNASLQRSVYCNWEGTPVNGGTAMLFMLPRIDNQLTVQYSIIDENGKLKYSGVQDWEHMIGHKFKVKNSSKNFGIVHGIKIKFPKEGYQIYDDFDNEKSVTLKHIK